MKQTKFAGLADANVNVPSTKITSLALIKSLIRSFSLVLCFIRQLTNQQAPFNFFYNLSGNYTFSVNQNENNE